MGIKSNALVYLEPPTQLPIVSVLSYPPDPPSPTHHTGPTQIAKT